MNLAAKLILHCPISSDAALIGFVQRCVADGVAAIAVWGEGCEAVHDRIDDLIVGDGIDLETFILTSWHRDESLAEVIEFLKLIENEAGIIRQVRI